MNYTKAIFISVIGYIVTIAMLGILSPTNELRDMVEITACVFGIACTLCLFGFINNNLLTNKNQST